MEIDSKLTQMIINITGSLIFVLAKVHTVFVYPIVCGRKFR